MVTLRKPKRSRAIIYLFECESKPYFFPYGSVFAKVVKFSKKKKEKQNNNKKQQTNKHSK